MKADDFRAFPRAHHDTMQTDNGGMTLRDYFAGQVLAGELAKTDGFQGAANLAKYAYEVADAMLKERLT